MSVVCPRGHQSQATDYCDQCGALIVAGCRAGADRGRGATSLPGRRGGRHLAGRAPGAVPRLRRRALGRRPLLRELRLRLPRSAAGAVGWEAIVTADRAQFDRLAVAGVSFPADYAERRFALHDGENRIGRSRGHPDERRPRDRPGGGAGRPGRLPPARRCSSAARDGGIVVRDLGSTNGTMVNDDPAPIAPHTAIPLADGDRVRVGAWTTITVRRR